MDSDQSFICGYRLCLAASHFDIADHTQGLYRMAVEEVPVGDYVTELGRAEVSVTPLALQQVESRSGIESEKRSGRQVKFHLHHEVAHRNYKAIIPRQLDGLRLFPELLCTIFCSRIRTLRNAACARFVTSSSGLRCRALDRKQKKPSPQAYRCPLSRSGSHGRWAVRFRTLLVAALERPASHPSSDIFCIEGGLHILTLSLVENLKGFALQVLREGSDVTVVGWGAQMLVLERACDAVEKVCRLESWSNQVSSELVQAKSRFFSVDFSKFAPREVIFQDNLRSLLRVRTILVRREPALSMFGEVWVVYNWSLNKDLRTATWIHEPRQT